VERAIVGFHLDEEGHWVAELSCGHGQHTRHDPPLSERSWVLSEEGRAQRIGTQLDCLRCERRELPEGHAAYRRTATFREDAIPRGLLSRHRTARGVWARIHVESGSLLYRTFAPFDDEQRLDAGAVGVVLPDVEHEVEPCGAVSFHVEFYRAAGDASDGAAALGEWPARR